MFFKRFIQLQHRRTLAIINVLFPNRVRSGRRNDNLLADWPGRIRDYIWRTTVYMDGPTATGDGGRRNVMYTRFAMKIGFPWQPVVEG